LQICFPNANLHKKAQPLRFCDIRRSFNRWREIAAFYRDQPNIPGNTTGVSVVTI